MSKVYKDFLLAKFSDSSKSPSLIFNCLQIVMESILTNICWNLQKLIIKLYYRVT